MVLSSSVMTVVTVPIVTVAVVLLSVTGKLSGPSTIASSVVCKANCTRVEPDARVEPLLLVTVMLMAPFAPADVVKLRLLVRLAAISAVKSVPSVAVPDAVSSVKLILSPAARDTPFKLTV